MKNLLILFLLPFSFFSCKKDPYPLNDLVGNWDHDFDGYSGTGKAEQYFLSFDCDGRYALEIKTFTDVDSTDGCFTAYYFDYGLGSYNITGNQLRLTGSFERQFATGSCERKIHFDQTYEIEKLDSQNLKLKRIPKDANDELTTIEIPLNKTFSYTTECD